MLLLVSDFLITGRKSSWALRLPFVKTAGRRKKQQAAALALLLISAAWSSQLRASEGEEFFEAGQYDQAGRFYQKALQKKPEDPVLHFNLADSAYRQNDYEHAVAEFNKALKTDDLSLQADSYYNRGNALYYLGVGTEKTDTEHTVKLWQQAMESFQASLALKPDDKKAAHNLEVVRKKLEQLTKQQKKNQEQQKDSKDKQDRQKQGNQKENQKNSDNSNNSDQEQQQIDNSSSENSDEQNRPQQNGDYREQPDPGREDNGDNNQGKNKEQLKQENEDTADEQRENNQETGVEKKQQQPAAGNSSGGQKEMSRQDMERRQQGKMTREEATNLLNSLKGEQGELNFIPQGSDLPDSETRDW